MNRSLAGLLATALVLLTAAAASAAGRPDLEVTYVSEPPSALQPGDEFTTTVRVENAGRAKAGRSSARFYVSQDKVLEASESVLVRDTHAVKAGASTLLAGRFAVPTSIETAKQYFVFVCLDTRKKVKESNERNNCTGSATLLFVRPKP